MITNSISSSTSALLLLSCTVGVLPVEPLSKARASSVTFTRLSQTFTAVPETDDVLLTAGKVIWLSETKGSTAAAKIDVLPEDVLALYQRLAVLAMDTASPNWDLDRGAAIPRIDWIRAGEFCSQIRQALPSLPFPVPSPCGDGTVFLRWSKDGRRFAVELVADHQYRWSARHPDGSRPQGECTSTSELISLLREHLK